jgi:hypothetical protein
MATWCQTAASLVVVEDPLIGKLVHSVLGRYGLETHTASADNVLNLLSLPGSRIGVVVTNKPWLFLEFADHLPLLYLAGDPDYRWVGLFRACRVLRKPFHPQDLLTAVEALLSNG